MIREIVLRIRDAHSIPRAGSLLAMTAAFVFCLAQARAAGPAPLEQDWSAMTTLQPGPYAVGFRLIDLADPARPGISSAAQRQIRAWVWYPAGDTIRESGGTASASASASGSTSGSVSLSRYLRAAAEDFSMHGSHPVEEYEAHFREKLVRHGVGEEDLPARLATRMLAREDAPFPADPRPLVVLGQGLYYESPLAQAVLSEYLATHGFAVATSALMGTSRPEMELSVEDFATQAADLALLLKQIPGRVPVDSTRIAAAGFDLGGMAALLVQMNAPAVHALVSLDAGIIFTHNIELLEQTPGFRGPGLTVPTLQITREAEHNRGIGVEEDFRYFAAATTEDLYLVRVPGMRHPDLTSYLFYATAPVELPFWGPEVGDQRAAQARVAAMVRDFLGAFLLDDADARARLDALTRTSPAAQPGITIARGRAIARAGAPAQVTVPMVLDHNRMLIDGEFARVDGSRRPARLWIDSGNPDFLLSEALARDLGVDLSAAPDSVVNGRMEIAPPAGLRLGGLELDLSGVKAYVMFQPPWLFHTMHNDANFPSTVLHRYHVVFDYPARQMTLAQPGSLQPRGQAVPASVHPGTGILQMDAVIAGERFSFAFDNGAAYTFVSASVLDRLTPRHPDWPVMHGALGCANIWGWWPQEEAWPVLRVPELHLGEAVLSQVGLVGIGEIFGPGFDLGAWYSQKTARPVNGFLGPNAYEHFRVEIDYANSTVYLERDPHAGPGDSYDMDLVGLTLRPENDGGYTILGVTSSTSDPAVPGAQAGDKLVRIDGWDTAGATMGSVVDALRGTPGETRILLIERDGETRSVGARVERHLDLAPENGGTPEAEPR